MHTVLPSIHTAYTPHTTTKEKILLTAKQGRRLYQCTFTMPLFWAKTFWCELSMPKTILVPKMFCGTSFHYISMAVQINHADQTGLEFVMGLESFRFSPRVNFKQRIGFTWVPGLHQDLDSQGVALNCISQGPIKAKLTSLHTSCLPATRDNRTSWYTFCLRVIGASRLIYRHKRSKFVISHGQFH